MIKIPGPAMACNAADMGNFMEYKMWNTRTVKDDVPPAALAVNIVSVANSAPKGVVGARACYVRKFALEALVLNCHGYPGHLGLGTGIDASTVGGFSVLKGLIPRIYIVSCGVAGIRKNKSHTGYLDGPSFCISLAQATGADVIAPTNSQRQSKEDRSDGIPMGYIDDYEGDVRLFSKDGKSSPWKKAAD
jgi:hypothetical protein